MSSDNRRETNEPSPDAPDAKAGGETGVSPEVVSKEVYEVCAELDDSIKNTPNDGKIDNSITNPSEEEDQAEDDHSCTPQAVREDVLDRSRQLPHRPAFGLMRSATQMDATKEHEVHKLRGVDHEVRELSRLRGVSPDSLDQVDGLSPSSSRSRSLSVLPAIHETLEEHTEEPRPYSSASSSSSGSSMTSSPGCGRRIGSVRRVSSRPTLTSISEEAAGRLGPGVCPGKPSAAKSSSTELVKKGEDSTDEVHAKTSASRVCPVTPSVSETGSGGTNSVTDLLQAPVPGQNMTLRDFVAKKIEEVESRLGRRGLVEISDVMEAVNQVYTRDGRAWRGEAGEESEAVMCQLGEEQVMPLCDVIDNTDTKPAVGGLNIYINNVVLSCICEVILQLGLQRSKVPTEGPCSDDHGVTGETRGSPHTGRPRGSGSASRVNQSTPRESHSDHAPSSMSDEKLIAKDNESVGGKSWEKDGQRRVRERELNKKPGVRTRARERQGGGLKNATGDTHRCTHDLEPFDCIYQEGRDRKSSCQLEFIAGNTDTSDNTSGTESDPDLARTISNCRFGKRTSTNRQKNTTSPLTSITNDQDDDESLCSDRTLSIHEERTEILKDPQAGDSVDNTEQKRKGKDKEDDKKLNLHGFGDRLKDESQNHPGSVTSLEAEAGSDSAQGEELTRESLDETQSLTDNNLSDDHSCQSLQLNNQAPELINQPQELDNQTRETVNVDNQNLKTETDLFEATNQQTADSSHGDTNPPLDVNNQSLEFDNQTELGPPTLQVSQQPHGNNKQQSEVNESQVVKIPLLDGNTEVQEINKMSNKSLELNPSLEISRCPDAGTPSSEANELSQDANDSIDDGDWSLEVNQSQDVDNDEMVKSMIQSLNEEAQSEGIGLFLQESNNPNERGQWEFKFFDGQTDDENSQMVNDESTENNIKSLKMCSQSEEFDNYQQQLYDWSVEIQECSEAKSYPQVVNDESLDVNKQWLEDNGLSEVNNQPLEEHNESVEVEEKPSEANNETFEVNYTVKVSDTVEVNNTLETDNELLRISIQKLEDSNDSVDINDQQLKVSVEVYKNQLEVNNKSFSVNDQLLQVSKESLEVKANQLEGQVDPVDVNEEQLEVNNESLEVKIEPIKVNELLEVNEQHHESNNEFIDEESLKVNNKSLKCYDYRVDDSDQQQEVSNESVAEKVILEVSPSAEVDNESLEVNKHLQFNSGLVEVKNESQESLKVSNKLSEGNHLVQSINELRENDKTKQAVIKLLEKDNEQAINELLKNDNNEKTVNKLEEDKNNEEETNELLENDNKQEINDLLENETNEHTVNKLLEDNKIEQKTNELLKNDNNEQTVNKLEEDNNNEKETNELLENDNKQAINELLENETNEHTVKLLEYNKIEQKTNELLENDISEQLVNKLLDDDNNEQKTNDSLENDINKQTVNKLLENDNSKLAFNELSKDDKKEQSGNTVPEINNKLDKTLAVQNETQEDINLVQEKTVNKSLDSLENKNQAKLHIKDALFTQKLDDENSLHNTDAYKTAKQMSPESPMSRLEDGHNFDEICDRAIDALKALNVVGTQDGEYKLATTRTDSIKKAVELENYAFATSDDDKLLLNNHHHPKPELTVSNNCVAQDVRKTDIDSESTEDTITESSQITIENSIATVSSDVDKCEETSNSKDDTSNLPADTVFGQISRVMQQVNGESDLVKSGIVPEEPAGNQVALKDNEVILVCQPSQKVLFQSRTQSVDDRPPMESLAFVVSEPSDVKSPAAKEADRGESITVRVNKIRCPKCREHNEAVCKLRIDVSAVVEEVDGSEKDCCPSGTLTCENEGDKIENSCKISDKTEAEKAEPESIITEKQDTPAGFNGDIIIDSQDKIVNESNVKLDHQENTPNSKRDIIIKDDCGDTAGVKNDILVDNSSVIPETGCYIIDNTKNPTGIEYKKSNKHDGSSDIEAGVLRVEGEVGPERKPLPANDGMADICDTGNNQEQHDDNQTIGDTGQQITTVEICDIEGQISQELGKEWIGTDDIKIAIDGVPGENIEIEPKDEANAEPSSNIDGAVLKSSGFDEYATGSYDETVEGNQIQQITDNDMSSAYCVTQEGTEIPQATENALGATVEKNKSHRVTTNESPTKGNKPDQGGKSQGEVQTLSEICSHAANVGHTFDSLCGRAIDAIKAFNEDEIPYVSTDENKGEYPEDNNEDQSKLLQDKLQQFQNEILAYDDGFSTTDQSTTEELASGCEQPIIDGATSEETTSNDESSKANAICHKVVVSPLLKTVTITEDSNSTTIRLDHEFTRVDNKTVDMRYRRSNDVSPERDDDVPSSHCLMDQNADSHTRLDLASTGRRHDYWDDCCPWHTDSEVEGAVASGFNYKTDALPSFTGEEQPLIDVMEVTCQQTHDVMAERPLPPSGADTAISLHTSRNSLGAVALHLVSNDDEEDDMQDTHRDLDHTEADMTYMVTEPRSTNPRTAEWGGARPKEPKFILAKEPSKKPRYRKRSRSPRKELNDIPMEDLEMEREAVDLLAHHTSPSASFTLCQGTRLETAVLDAKLQSVVAGGSEDEGTRGDDEAEDEAADRPCVRPAKASPAPPPGQAKKRLVDVTDFPPDGPRLYVRGSTSVDVPTTQQYRVDPKKVGIWGKFKKALNPTSRKAVSSTSAAGSCGGNHDNKSGQHGGRDNALLKPTRRNSFKSATLPSHSPVRQSATASSLSTSKRSSTTKTNKLQLLKGSAETMSGPIPALRKHRTGSGANLMRTIGMNNATSGHGLCGDSHRTSPKKSVSQPKSILKNERSASVDSMGKLPHKSPIRVGSVGRSLVREGVHQKNSSRVSIDLKTPPRGKTDQKSGQKSSPSGNSDQKSPFRLNNRLASPVRGSPILKRLSNMLPDLKSPASRKNNDQKDTVRESADQKALTPVKNQQKSHVHTNNERTSPNLGNDDNKSPTNVNDQKIQNSPKNEENITSVLESNDQNSSVCGNNETNIKENETIEKENPVCVNEQISSLSSNNEQKKINRGNNEEKSPIKGCLKNPILESPNKQNQQNIKIVNKKGPVRGSPIKKRAGSPVNLYYRKSPKRKSPKKKTPDPESLLEKNESQSEKALNSITHANEKVKNNKSVSGTVLFSGPGQNNKSSGSSLLKKDNMKMEGEDAKKKMPSFQEELGQWWAESESQPDEIVQRISNIDKIISGKKSGSEVDAKVGYRSRSRSRSVSPTRPLRPKSIAHIKDTQRRKQIYTQLFETTDPHTYRPPPPKKWMCRVM